MRAWTIGAALACLGLFTANPLLTAACVLAVPLFMQLLWREGGAPVLLLVVMYQWLQVATRVLHADTMGASLASAGAWDPPIERAVALGLVALVVLAAGQSLVLRRVPQFPLEQVAAERARLSPKRLFVLYAVLLVAGQALEPLRWVLLPLMQAMVVISTLRWIPLFMLAHVAFIDRRGRGLLAAALLFEVALGFGAYFSAFKTVFFVLMVAALTGGGGRLRPVTVRGWVAAGTMGAVLVGLVLVWQGIKGEYRAFLNQGAQQQVVLVSWPERAARVVTLVGMMEADDIDDALRSGVERLSYVDYFADALAYVPDRTPHAGGAIWGAAVRHVLTPRLLFPDKPVLPSDSELTMRYTGNRLASGAQGTSISLGYVAESYVDFGVWLMFLPVFLMGLLQGWIYRFFVRLTPLRLLGYGCALVSLLPSMLFETTAVKYLGGTLYVVIVLGLLMRFAARPVVSRITVARAS